MKKLAIVSAVSGAMGVASFGANAALPVEVTTAITELQGDAILLLGAVGVGAVAVMTVGLVWTLGLSLVPKFLKRGAKA